MLSGMFVFRIVRRISIISLSFSDISGGCIAFGKQVRFRNRFEKPSNPETFDETFFKREHRNAEYNIIDRFSIRNPETVKKRRIFIIVGFKNTFLTQSTWVHVKIQFNSSRDLTTIIYCC